MQATFPQGRCPRGNLTFLLGLILACGLGWASFAAAQDPLAPASSAASPEDSQQQAVDAAFRVIFLQPGENAPPGAQVLEIIPVGCSNCGPGGAGAGLGANSGAAPGTSGSGPLGPLPLPPPPDLPKLPDANSMPCCACNGSGCVPGRQACKACEGHTVLGRFLCGLYGCICCPDPCYEGRWYPLADSAFFVDAVRPINQSKIRWDSGNNVVLMDRSEWFWARSDGMGAGPRPPNTTTTNPTTGQTTTTSTAPSFPPYTDLSLRYNDLVMVTEGGNGVVSIIVETPYRNLQTELGMHSSGFADMNIATKTLLFDCELMQMSMQFKTYIPVGSSLKGLGVGHVSLEPSLLLGVKLSPTCYFQAQVAEWIPLGGDPGYAGSVLHYHFSANKEVCRILPDVPFIMNCEFSGWSFQGGAYTDPLLGPLQKSSGYTYASMGGGFRIFVCDKLDFGFGALFSLTDEHWARDLYRTEFRLRF